LGAVSTEEFERLLRWYPSAWRARYGPELVALMEDTYGDQEPLTVRRRLGIVRTGLFERIHQLGVAPEVGPGQETRSGSLLVLFGWALFVVAGMGFAKLAEHWDVVTPRHDWWLPSGAFDAVQWSAGIGAVVLLVAIAVASPALVNWIRDGGWSDVRRPIWSAVIVSSVTTAMTAGMIIWAHHVGPVRPGGRSPSFPVVGGVWALLVVATIATVTVAAAVIAARLQLSARVLRVEGCLALLLTAAMVVVFGGMLLWWGAIATFAPQFLSGGESGLFDTPAPLTMVAAGLLMVAGLILALLGDGRVVRSFRRVPSI